MPLPARRAADAVAARIGRQFGEIAEHQRAPTGRLPASQQRQSNRIGVVAVVDQACAAFIPGSGHKRPATGAKAGQRRFGIVRPATAAAGDRRQCIMRLCLLASRRRTSILPCVQRTANAPRNHHPAARWNRPRPAVDICPARHRTCCFGASLASWRYRPANGRRR